MVRGEILEVEDVASPQCLIGWGTVQKMVWKKHGKRKCKNACGQTLTKVVPV